MPRCEVLGTLCKLIVDDREEAKAVEKGSTEL